MKTLEVPQLMNHIMQNHNQLQNDERLNLLDLEID